jgi:hypothetical protein
VADFLSREMEGESIRFTQGKQREKQTLHGINKVVELYPSVPVNNEAAFEPHTQQH